jgi:predicted ferric reductase
MLARVQGGHGGFNYKSGARQQVWVAGGIGITPFLSWLRDFGERLEQQIDFYYTVRSADEVLYLDEIQAAAARQPNFRPHIHVTAKDGRLTAEKIAAESGSLAGKEFSCAVFQMTEALRGR